MGLNSNDASLMGGINVMGAIYEKRQSYTLCAVVEIVKKHLPVRADNT